MGILCAIISCSRETTEICDVSPVEVGFFAGGTSTRTSMLDNGLSAAWNPGDCASVWAANSASEYVLEGQVFSIYGIDDGFAYFTSTLAGPMADATYTYYACYPEPTSVSGSLLSFNLPALQDGRAGKGTDIMLATPSLHGPLTSLEEQPAGGGLSLGMNHMMHQFRFWTPSGEGAVTEKIREISFSMPDPVAGVVTVDFKNPDTPASISSGVNEMTLTLEKPIGASDYPGYDFAIASVHPHPQAYGPDDYMTVTLFTDSGKSVLEPISLSGRSFLPGHSTPVCLRPSGIEKYYRIKFTVDDNNIGETLWNITIFNGDTQIYKWSNTQGYHSNFTIEEEYLGTSGEAEYLKIVNAIENGTARLNFETANTSVDLPLTASCITRNDNISSISLGSVPYLLYEDFTSARAYEQNDAYSGSANSDRNLGGYLLDGYMDRNGWNASRFKILEGDCIRINSRYQSGAWTVERLCGRLDTPALSYLKPGASVTIVLEYDEAFYVPAGYNRDDSSTPMAKYRIGTHTNSESTSLNGCKSDNISSNAAIVFTSDRFANEDVSNLHHRTQEISSVGQSTRIVFFSDTDRTTSVIAANSCYYLYLDNLKVYIKN